MITSTTPRDKDSNIGVVTYDAWYSRRNFCDSLPAYTIPFFMVCESPTTFENKSTRFSPTLRKGERTCKLLVALVQITSISPIEVAKLTSNGNNTSAVDFVLHETA